jgi:SAM-dependent methyltransferase
MRPRPRHYGAAVRGLDGGFRRAAHPRELLPRFPHVDNVVAVTLRPLYSRLPTIISLTGVSRQECVMATGPNSPRMAFAELPQAHLPTARRVRIEGNVTSDKRLISASFPRSSQYHPEWVLASASGGANSLWLTEWLASALNLRSGMRVLDLGCGRAASSIFLRREFGVVVWATDLWFSVSEKIQRIRDARVEDGVFPIHADARSLPFATEFFDAIVSIDSFPYYGTDDLYLNYLARFVKPGGQIGTAGAGLVREIEASPPQHLRQWWTQDLWCLH